MVDEKLIDLVKTIINSDLPISTRKAITEHFMLPQGGGTKAPVEIEDIEIGTVERPDSEEIKIQNNPKLKAEYQETERVMTGRTQEEDE